jgi:hypothetical protein
MCTPVVNSAILTQAGRTAVRCSQSSSPFVNVWAAEGHETPIPDRRRGVRNALEDSNRVGVSRQIRNQTAVYWDGVVSRMGARERDNTGEGKEIK